MIEQQANTGTWGVFNDEDAVHVIPIDDWVEHEHSSGCICRPEVEVGYKNLVIHDAADGRK